MEDKWDLITPEGPKNDWDESLDFETRSLGNVETRHEDCQEAPI